jgi:hypothetical protein
MDLIPLLKLAVAAATATSSGKISMAGPLASCLRITGADSPAKNAVKADPPDWTPG